jgi:trehalose 6-phosphate phosphatase
MERPDQDRALLLARAALATAPAGLVTDLDGTLAPIVADPAAARALPGAAEALASLAERLAVVAVASGRAAADARRILGRDDLLVVGNHGVEWLEPGASASRWVPGLAGAAAAVERALVLVALPPGVAVERKGASATLHFRRADDPAGTRDLVVAELERAAIPGVSVRAGRMSLELRPSAAGDKGTALETLVRTHGLRGLVVLGDDVTDLDMFRTAARLRRDGGLHAAILAVAASGEVPDAVGEAADAVLEGPERAVELLRRL